MLLFNIDPYKDESLASFVYRTAVENQMDNLNWIIYNFKDFSNLDIIPNEINWLKDRKLEKMADFLSIALPKANELSFLSTLNKLQLDIRSIEKNPWFLYSRTKCCPTCLKEKIFHKKAWSSSHSIICIKHDNFLIDSCPICNISFDIQSIIKNRCKKCSFRISSSHSRQISHTSYLVNFQEIIDSFFTDSHYIFKHPHISSFTTFIKALEFMGNWAVRFLPAKELDINEYSYTYDGKAEERNRLKNAKSVEQAICIYNFAFKVLEKWPTNFHKMINIAECSNKKGYKNFIHTIVSSLFGSDLSFISTEFNNYIAHEKLRRPKQHSFIRIEQIKLLSKKFNASITKSKLLTTYRYQYINKDIDLVSLEDIESILKDYETSLTKDELKKRWDMSSIATLSILENNLINDTFNFCSGSTITWVIRQNAVDSFENKLNTFSHSFNEQSLTLNRAIEWVSPNNANVIFEGILSNRIKFCLSKASLGEGKICKEDVYHFVTKNFLDQGQINGTISIRKLVFILGVKKSDIKYWLEGGKFGSVPKTNLDNIPIKNVIPFMERYLTTHQLSIIHKISIKKLNKLHTIGKIISLSGPNLRDGERLLFERQKYMFSLR